MMKSFLGLLVILPVATAAAEAPAPTAREIVDRVLDSDPWGLTAGAVHARATLIDKRGSTSVLAFTGRSRRYDPPLSKTLVRFSAPEDLAGAAFLQVQNRDRDDERFLYLPALSASRRISGNLRSSSFMGTDFSFADLDRRDLRTGTATLLPSEMLGKNDCYRVDITPGEGAAYSKISLWVRKDDFVPLKWQWSDKAGQLEKTLTASEVRRIAGQSFITESTMVNHREHHTTKLVLDQVEPKVEVTDDELTTARLEKL